MSVQHSILLSFMIALILTHSPEKVFISDDLIINLSH